MLTIPTRTMLRASDDIKKSLYSAMNSKKYSVEYVSKLSNQIWALNELEDRLLTSREAPLTVLEKFAYKLKVYSANEEEFSDCVAILDVLYDMVIC